MDTGDKNTFEREREIFFEALEKKTEESRSLYLGEACGEGLCAGDLDCVGDVCVAKSFLGGACDDAATFCSHGLCVDGRCEPRLPLGSPCTEDDECRSRDCIDGACVDDPLCEFNG